MTQRRELLLAHEWSVLARQRELKEHLQAIRDKLQRCDSRYPDMRMVNH